MPVQSNPFNDNIKPFFSAAQLHQLREVALSGMTQPITVQRKSSSDTDYGDAEQLSWTTVAITKGWIHSSPTPVMESDSGAVITVNTYRLFVPVGTDIMPSDQVLVGSDVFVVSDTTAESTWQAMTVASLRKRE